MHSDKRRNLQLRCKILRKSQCGILPSKFSCRGRISLMDDLVEKTFPFVAALPPRLREALRAKAVRKALDDRQVLVSGGADCAWLPFVLEGALRIYKVSETGKELTLYRIEQGESCILTATCILNGGSFPAIAEAQGHTQVLLLPAPFLNRLVEEDTASRQFIFRQYAHRLDAVLSLVEEVTFHHMDMRIAAFLLRNAAGSGAAVSVTHGKIAAELGTSREVVTRILADFETEKLISTSRGRVMILKPAGLKERSGISAEA
jgi:CRP/FNR family transcriptional regulator, anaerobic regulatory protein